MMNKTVFFAGAVVLASAIQSTPAVAASASVTAQITRVLLTSNDNYGGCMAKLSADPAIELPACKPSWLSFSCTGDFTDAVRAYRMLDQAQLAIATGNQVEIWYTDSSLHNGYCVATRIDMFQ